MWYDKECVCIGSFVQCLYVLCVMCSEQAGLLLTAIAAPWGICRRKALLRLAMEGWEHNTGQKDAWGFVWILQTQIHLSVSPVCSLPPVFLPLNPDPLSPPLPWQSFIRFLHHHQKCCSLLQNEGAKPFDWLNKLSDHFTLHQQSRKHH